MIADASEWYNIDGIYNTATLTLLDAATNLAPSSIVSLTNTIINMLDAPGPFTMSLKLQVEYEGDIFTTNAFDVSYICPSISFTEGTTESREFDFIYPTGTTHDIINITDLHSPLPTECPATYDMKDGNNKTLSKTGIALSATALTLDDGYEIDPAQNTEIEVVYQG
jgi:hypothetical protein